MIKIGDCVSGIDAVHFFFDNMKCMRSGQVVEIIDSWFPMLKIKRQNDTYGLLLNNSTLEIVKELKDG